ncbi:MAG: hypothetical protein LBB08_02085, partial [Rickettsiales bacterium]|nr:hypothetical protein [Rickettsiales bacterium]
YSYFVARDKACSYGLDLAVKPRESSVKSDTFYVVAGGPERTPFVCALVFYRVIFSFIDK